MPRFRTLSIFLVIAILIGAIYFFLFAPSVSSWNNPYWSFSGKYVYTGPLHSLEAVPEFFTGSFLVQKVDQSYTESTDPHQKEILTYVEYPRFANASIDLIKQFFAREKDDINLMLVGERDDIQKDAGYPNLIATFRLESGNHIGSIIYNYKRDVLSLGKESDVTVFLMNAQGEYLDAKSLLRIDTDAKKAEFVQFLSQKIHDSIDANLLLSGANLSETLTNYLDNPKFSFSGSNVTFYFSPGLIGTTDAGILTLTLPYQDVASWLALTSPIDANRFRRNEKKLVSSDGKKYIALTFDDGPSNKTTPRLLDILKEKNVHVTFYILGEQAQKFPEIVKREHDEGHELGNHSWDHTELTKLTANGMAWQIQTTNDEITKAAGVSPTSVRPPYGSQNATLRDVVGAPIVMWSVDTLDWKYRNAQKDIDSALAQMHEGAIILFHDIHAESVDAIPRLIDELEKRGYTLVTVSELYKKYNSGATMSIGEMCFSAENCR